MKRFLANSRNHAWLIVAVTVSLLHFGWLASNVVCGFAGPDADGYFGQAGLIVKHGRTTFEVESPAQYLGIQWLEKDDGGFVSRYPPGLPALLAAVWVTFGRDAAFYVNPALASLTVFFVFWFCRRWVGTGPALAAAIVQAFNVESNFHSLASTSHTAATFFLVAGLAVIDRWADKGSRFAALAAGALLGVLPSVRYAEAAAAVGIIVFLAFIARRPDRRSGIPWVLAGAVLPVGWMLVRNQVEFGAFWRTAYYLTDESNLSLEYFLENWPLYLPAPLNSGVGLFYALGLVGLVLMIRDRESRPLGISLALVVTSITVVYTSYYFTAGGSAVGPGRFLLPVLPLYLLPAFYFLKQKLDTKPLIISLCLLVLVQALPGFDGISGRLARQRSGSIRGAKILAALEDKVPDGSVLFLGERSANDQVHYAQRWKLADASLLSGPGRGFGMGRRRPGRDPDRPSPMQREKATELRAVYDDLSGPERTAAVLDDVEQWAQGQEVFWVLPQDQGESGLAAIDGLAFHEKLGTIEFPESDRSEDVEPPTGRRRFGGPGGRGPRAFAGPGGGFGGRGFPGPPGLGPGTGGPRGRRFPGFGGRSPGGGLLGGGSGPLDIYRLVSD